MTRARRTFLTASVRWLLFAALCTSCSKPPPNVVIVTFDTARYDRFGFAGDASALTPHVDALAARGVSFDRAYSSVPLTLPAHTTMLTGLEPFEHGVHNNGHFQVPDSIPTLAELLRTAGFDTAAFVSAAVLEAQHKLARGFDVYDDETNKRRGTLDTSVPKRRGDETTGAAIRWLDGRSGSSRPFFLWIHYFDPHRPYQLPPEYEARSDRYAASISFADAELGRLLERVAAVEGERGTLVLFTSDHGESLGEHGESTHGLVAYDSTLRVPLIVSGPGAPRGVRSAALTGHADMMPTILAAAGVRAPKPLSGRSLFDAAREDASAADSLVRYFECEAAHFEFGWAPLAGVRTARWKYTATPEPPELYDVLADPHELHDVVDQEPEVRARMEEQWAEIRARREAETPDARLLGVSLETMERLAALGYVQAPQTFAPGEAPDPRKFVATQDWMDRARDLARAGKFGPAIEQLEALRQSASIRVLVLRTLAPMYAEAGRLEDSIQTFREYIDLAQTEESRLGLARVLIAADRSAEALALLDALEQRDAASVVTLRAVALADLGRRDEARALIDEKLTGTERQRLRAVVVIEGAPLEGGEAELRALATEAPEDPRLKSWLGYYIAVWGRPDQAEEALALLRAAARAHPHDAEFHANLGWAAYRLGRNDEAIAELAIALRIDGTRQRERFRLAFALARHGDRERAIGFLKEAIAARPGAAWAKDEAPRMIALLEQSASRGAKAEASLRGLARAAD